MKQILILFCTITFVMANVCKDQTEEVGSPLSGTFEIPGASYTYLFNIFDDQDKSLLYFVGYYRNVTDPKDTVIYKSDYNLSKVKVMTYNIDLRVYSITMDSDGDFIYMMDLATNKIIEISTNDLTVARELAISTATVSSTSNIKAKKNVFFSLKLGSMAHTCRWDTLTTNLDWFSFGVHRHTNFAPISDNLLFFGSRDLADDEYYLINYNFSDPSNLVWKKAILCPATAWLQRTSTSILSQNEEFIYAMILFGENFIFHKLSVADGSPQASGLIWNDVNFSNSYSMREFNDYVAVQIYTSTFSTRKRLILVKKDDLLSTKEFNSIVSLSYAIGRLIYKGKELMYHCGKYQDNRYFLFARSLPNNIDQLPEFEEDTPLFSPINSDYQISDTTSNPSLTNDTKTLIISTSPSITSTDVTASVSSSFTTKVALWNQDHIQNVQSNSLVQVDFIWACTLSSSYTEITFTLTQTGSNEIPEWVDIDIEKQELYLNKTPKLTNSSTYYFSLQISFDSETQYKQFEITVEQWSITNWEICQLGSPDLWETCRTGFETSNDKASWSKVQAISGATEAAAALGAASVMMASASSVLSLSSVNSIFSVMNSLQLAIQLPLVPDYFSPKVLAFLSGMGFSMMSFDFLKFKDIPFVIAITEWVSYPQSDEYLNSIGMRSGSSVVNYLSLMAFIIFLGVIHFGIVICSKWADQSDHRKCKKWLDRLFLFFTFNIYVRVFIQAFAFTTLSIFSEMYLMNLSTLVTKVSFGLCIIFAMWKSVLFILSFIMYAKSFPEFDSQKYWPWTEYFNGVKLTKFSKLYSSMFMLVRLMLISLLVFGRSAGHTTKTTYFYLINIAYCLYLLVVRPLENPQDNIIEIVNQSLFCCLAVPLSWLKTEAKWTPFYEGYYTSILSISPSIWALIWFIFLLKSISTYTKKCRTTNKNPTITPKKPSIPPRIPTPTPSNRPSSLQNPPSSLSNCSILPPSHPPPSSAP